MLDVVDFYVCYIPSGSTEIDCINFLSFLLSVVVYFCWLKRVFLILNVLFLFRRLVVFL